MKRFLTIGLISLSCVVLVLGFQGSWAPVSGNDLENVFVGDECEPTPNAACWPAKATSCLDNGALQCLHEGTLQCMAGEIIPGTCDGAGCQVNETEGGSFFCNRSTQTKKTDKCRVTGIAVQSECSQGEKRCAVDYYELDASGETVEVCFCRSGTIVEVAYSICGTDG